MPSLQEIRTEVDVTKIIVEVAKEGEEITEEEEEEADIKKGEGTRIKEVKEVKEAEDKKKIITKDIKDINNLIIPQYATSIQHNI